MDQPGLHGRYRDKNGELSKKHGNTLVRTLRKVYGQHFAEGCAPEEKLSVFQKWFRRKWHQGCRCDLDTGALGLAIATPDGRDQWYVITGPPCCGKSMTVELLAQRGLRVRSEIARAYVDEEIAKGRTIQEIRSDMRRFQCEILRRALASEAALPRDELVFFDRGVPDSLAYFRLHRIPAEPYMKQISSSKYRTVFYLDPLDELRITSVDRSRFFKVPRLH